jgi:hypothetical protein
MRILTLSLSALFTLTLTQAGCSSAPNDTTASAAQALTGGTPTTLPVVQLATGDAYIPYCTGTLVSPSWVLTGSCLPVHTACVPAQGPCASVATMEFWNRDYDIELLHLASPLAAPSYAALSTTALTDGSVVTCSDWSSEGSFTVAPAGGDVLLAPAGTAQLTPDHGDGCFEGNTLVAIQDGGPLAKDVAAASSWVTSVMCGGRTCGTVVDDGHPIACGTCDDGERCVSGACQPVPLHCPHGMIDCGGYCGRPDEC